MPRGLSAPAPGGEPFVEQPAEEPYRRPGRRRRRGPGRSFYDWPPDSPSGLRDARPLISALQIGDMALAQGLLMAKSDPNGARDDAGRTALQLASFRGFVGLCRKLIGASAELNAGTALEGWTALHLAVMAGHALVLKLLLDARSCANIHSIDDETPLSLSVNDGNIDAIQQLLKARAQVDVGEEHSPFDATMLPGAREELPASASALIRAVQRSAQKELVEELICAGADVEAVDSQQNQPLHLAIRSGSTRVARLLLERRADPNFGNQELRTPLHCAAGAGVSRVVRMLAEHRADVNREDRQGMTPFQLATDPIVTQQIQRLGGKEGFARGSSMPSLRITGIAAAGQSSPSSRAARLAGGRQRGTWAGGAWSPSGTGGVLLKPQLSSLTSAILLPNTSSPPISPPLSPLSLGAPSTPAKRQGVRLPGVAWSGEPGGFSP
mmetsp:Transcript_25295/g.63832  ORF Transcript_25295/g.63832 Transcript_25295/m.63832 type:complete len:440 (+) Transcript_25295:91-1410(+)